MNRTLRTSLALLGFGAVTFASGALGALSTRRGRPWYRLLRKSPLNPPDRVFAPVWSSLYALSALSAARVFASPETPDRSRALAFWGAQQGFNALWSPLFFGRRSSRAALVDLGLLGLNLLAYARVARRVDPTATVLVLPYLAWTAFAGVLNTAIVRNNPRWLSG